MLHLVPARTVAEQRGRAGPPPDQAPGSADARLRELPDGAAGAGRRMAILTKRQVRVVPANDVSAQRTFVRQGFGLAA
jgi:hypothetical protein